MVNFYCRACGLYISVPAEYSSGRGVCPRCKTPLRIPRSLPENHPDYVEGLRYLADLFDTAPLPPTERPPIVTNAMGPSSRFKCGKCEREFESLRSTGLPQGQCPNCREVNKTPTTNSVEFPREYASNAQVSVSSVQEKGGWIMDGDFLVAPRSADQDPSDSIIQGLPLQSDDGSAPGSALNGAQKSSPDIDAQLAASLSTKSAPAVVKSVDDRQWFYLLREHQHGPVSTPKLQNLIQNGKVGLSVLVFHEGLKGWRPIEEFEELRNCAKAVETPEPSPETQTPAPLTGHELKRLYQKFLILLWLFVTAGCVFSLGLVMKQSLYALGKTFFMWANLILSFLIFLCVAYGFLMIILRWRFFRSAPMSIRLRTLIGQGGLMVCMVTTLILPLNWRGEEKREALDRDSVILAGKIYKLIWLKKFDETYTPVNWEEMRVNGQDYGEKFKRTRSEAGRLKLIEAAYDELLVAFEPFFYRSEMEYPCRFNAWRIIGRKDGDTVVQVHIPSSGKYIRFTLRANRLVALGVQ